MKKLAEISSSISSIPLDSFVLNADVFITEFYLLDLNDVKIKITKNVSYKFTNYGKCMIDV